MPAPSAVRSSFSLRTARNMGVRALLLVAVASVFPGSALGGVTSAFVGAPLRAGNPARRPAVAMSLRPSTPVVGAVRMGREDGGADKINKPGTGKPVGPGGGGGVTPGDGSGESERGGAGVAVLTKPPDVDKVPPFASRVRHTQCRIQCSDCYWQL
jgi:hypothetical protein